ncbi:hypothetical protein IEQ34_022625 [Dendrobium chrysotoxum]|uniref:Uncharacterized protein n=1 Tax=Dendrobium chrysotoxum TaxID=161865 RepID=A0AAV7FXZ7_DENCH|nr:hypothetical protein IEQ34_022625 [Dendrobium chrysotoxum]
MRWLGARRRNPHGPGTGWVDHLFVRKKASNELNSTAYGFWLIVHSELMQGIPDNVDTRELQCM